MLFTILDKEASRLVFTRRNSWYIRKCFLSSSHSLSSLSMRKISFSIIHTRSHLINISVFFPTSSYYTLLNDIHWPMRAYWSWNFKVNTRPHEIRCRGWKMKNSPLYSFSENRLPEANGLLTDCGAQGEAATRGRKGPYVRLYVSTRGGGWGDSYRGRRVSAGRETLVNNVGGGARGDKAPQCGAVDTTTTTTTTTIITTTHPLIRGPLALSRPIPISTLSSSVPAFFSFYLYVIVLIRFVDIIVRLRTNFWTIEIAGLIGAISALFRPRSIRLTNPSKIRGTKCPSNYHRRDLLRLLCDIALLQLISYI